MVNHNSHNGDVPSTPWESIYSGGASDYKEPDVDIIEAIADLDVGEALDVGCGAGGLCVELNRRGWAVTGIDITHKAITAARLAAEERGSDVRFVTADATTWQPEKSYDLVCNNFGLPPQPDSRVAVYAMMRGAVAAGGVVLIKIGDHSDEGRSVAPMIVGYESLNLEELKRGFEDFEVLKAECVDSPVHSHGGHTQRHGRRGALLFMARKRNN